MKYLNKIIKSLLILKIFIIVFVIVMIRRIEDLNLLTIQSLYIDILISVVLLKLNKGN